MAYYHFSMIDNDLINNLTGQHNLKTGVWEGSVLGPNIFSHDMADISFWIKIQPQIPHY